MRLQLPWHRTAAEIADLKERLAEAEERSTKTHEAAQQLVRMIADSPAYGAPVAPNGRPSGRPLYAYDHPIWYSTPQSPRRRPKAIVSLDTLRELADTYDIPRAAIQHLKREVSAVPIEVVSRDPERKSAQMRNRIKAATEWFTTPGGLGGEDIRRSQFEAAMIEDLLVIGATALHYLPTRGGGLHEVRAIDAATIRPRVDAFGWPGPGEAVYEQWIQGQLIRSFTREEMSFDGINAMSYTPYFKSPLEWILRPVLSGLAEDEWNQVWLTEGTTVTEKYTVPESWTPDMVQDWSDYWDSMLAGNSRERQKVKWLPGGVQPHTPTRHDMDFEEMEHRIMLRVVSMFGVSPAAIGYQERQYKVSQEGAMEQTTQYGVGEILEFRKAKYDDILVRRGDGDLECVNVIPQADRSKEKAETHKIRIESGQRTPNEARQEDGLDAEPGGDTLFVNVQLQPLEHALLPPRPPPGTNGDGQPGDDPSENQDGGSGPALTDRSLNSVDYRTRQSVALQQWERKAQKRLKSGRPALSAFASEDLSVETVEAVRERLAGAETREDVQRAFAEVREARTREMVGATWRERRRQAEADEDEAGEPEPE
jgi:phage portal protein BeeE